jgi:hypothetical protein
MSIPSTKFVFTHSSWSTRHQPVASQDCEFVGSSSSTVLHCTIQVRGFLGCAYTRENPTILPAILQTNPQAPSFDHNHIRYSDEPTTTIEQPFLHKTPYEKAHSL